MTAVAERSLGALAPMTARPPATAADFITTIFGALPDGESPWGCAFEGNPKTVSGAAWAGQSALTPSTPDPSRCNQYFTLATYRGSRAAANCCRIYGIVLDDVRDPGALALPPSVLIETSPGNHQALYLFAVPESDVSVLDRLLRAVIAQRLSDPGATSPATRYGRLPFGVNGKHTPPFPVRLAGWNPERRYTVAQIVQGLGLVLDPVKPPRSTAAGPDWQALPESKQHEIIADLRSALPCLSSDDRAQWIAVGEYLASMGDDGRELWTTWSQSSAKYNPGDEDRFDGFTGSRSDWRAVFAKADAAGWVNPLRRDPASIFGAGPTALPAGAMLTPPAVTTLPTPLLALLPAPIPVALFHRVKIDDLAHAVPAPQVFWWDGLMPADHVTSLQGHGGAGKSWLALMLAVSIATGRPFFGHATRRGKVLYFSAEDPGNLVRRRLAQICREWGIDPATLASDLHVLDATEPAPGLFAELRPGGARMGATTPTYHALVQYITANAIDVVMVDNASDTFEADEINRAAVRAFIRSLALLVRPRGGAVMLLAHVSKETSRAGRGAGSESYTGSTAWNNSVRSRLFIVSTGTGTYELRTEKAQFAPPRDPIAYTWPRDGLPQLADPTVTVSDKLPATQALLMLIHEYAGRPVGLYPSTSPTGRPQVSNLNP